MENKEKRKYATIDPEDIKIEFDRKYGPDLCDVLSRAIQMNDPEMKYAFTPEVADEFLAKKKENGSQGENDFREKGRQPVCEFRRHRYQYRP